MDLNKLNLQLKFATPQETLEYFLKDHNLKAALSSSFGPEDQVLTHLMLNIDNKANIFTLDTARLHPQTYEVMEKTNLQYKTRVKVYFPDTQKTQKLYQTQGINGFYKSIENRKECCYVRKIEPLQRALSQFDVWITGLRSSQSITRENLDVVVYDETNKVIKVNPLIHWSEKDVWDFIKENNIPYNSLHDEGYPSIGCAPCTRAVPQGEDLRSGRWWWENAEHKECGLHSKQILNYSI